MSLAGPAQAGDGARPLLAGVTITRGQATRLNLHLDTGLR